MTTQSQPQKNHGISLNRTAIYTRVSTEDQVEGYGLDVQLERCRAQAVAKGWNVIAEFEDAGFSGTMGPSERPGLAKLLISAQMGEIDSVIVLALDRLARKALLVLNIIDELRQCEVDLVSCKESLDTSTPSGRFVLTMFAAVSELERDNIVARTSAGREERSKKDGERGGRVPYGYHRSADGFIGIDQEAGSIVCHIFNLRNKGESLRQIAAKLNAEGIATARKGQANYSGFWRANAVKSILDNEEIYHGGQRYPSLEHWPKILNVSRRIKG